MQSVVGIEFALRFIEKVVSLGQPTCKLPRRAAPSNFSAREKWVDRFTYDPPQVLLIFWGSDKASTLSPTSIKPNQFHNNVVLGFPSDFSMSTTKDLNQADPSNIEDSSSDSFFVSYWKNRNSSSIAAAASAKKVETSLRYDFISFLGVTQELELDYLPITWQPKLDNVGEGGTADIRQSLINLQTSFAYKRIKWSRQAQWNESRNFQALISEVMVLGNPLIRKHPNVIRLEGICWDFPPGDDNVWPVLVFEKAQNGDLGKFVNSDIGKCISLEDRLKLCADVADALKYIHSYRELLILLLMQ